MCSRYSGAIRQTERYLQKLKKPHLEENLSKTDHTLVPKGGQVQRFNPQRFRRRQEKLGTQQQVNITDFEDFHNDEEVQKYVQDDVAVVVDFSGSMKSGTFNKCELAVQAACILREAGKRCGVNVDIFAFGDTSGPRVVASADMNDHQVGESIAGLKQGNSWGTALSPAFKGSKEHPGINEVLADTRGKNGNKVVGGTHLIIVSDGDLDHNDTEKALLTLENTLDAVPLLTTDWMIINPSEATQMDEMA
ncbi:MAG: vWA domain-containing protein, partial [Rickettsiales bacterium]